MPQISVILPIYNCEESLDSAVRSILDQDFHDFELILVDDGSTDGSLELIRKYEKSDARVKIIAQKHEGVVSAMNRGIEKSSSPLIARMDGDDLSDSRRLRMQKIFLDLHPETGLVGSRVKYGGDSLIQKGYAEYVNWTNELLTFEDIYLNRFIESPIANPTVMFRRTIVEKFGTYRDGDFPEDYELWLRWMKAGVKMEKLPEELITWNDPPGRLSRTDPRYSTEAFYRIKSGYLADFLRSLELQSSNKTKSIWVWGAGRVSGKRVKLLENEGIIVEGYIDVDQRKISNPMESRKIIHYDKLPGPGEIFVLGYVASRGARALIRTDLIQRGYSEGIDFIFAA